jgi:pseudouridine-5'-phosphate glycosidase/pseudouridine kinase
MPHLPPPAEQSINPARRAAEHEIGPEIVRNPDVLVVGGVAVDVSCDYVPPSSIPTPALHTSNPSRITESLGGVANNVAYAMHLSGTKAKLISCVGTDIAGRWVLEQVKTRGMDTSGIAVSKTYSTARYVAVNDSSGGLFIASADMEVIDQMFASQVISEISSSSAGWVCIDGNLSGETIVEVLRYCSKREIKGLPRHSSFW